MIAIICIDDNNGMAYNHRRQSKDRILKEHVVHMVGSKKIWMNSYGQKQFSDTALNIIVNENYLEKAGAEEFCFVETEDISKYSEKIEKIILFRWNRHYPADTFLTLDIKSWTLTASEDFPGYSHDKITKEIYIR